MKALPPEVRLCTLRPGGKEPYSSLAKLFKARPAEMEAVLRSPTTPGASSAGVAGAAGSSFRRCQMAPAGAACHAQSFCPFG